jgi:nicotinate-nucleotide adenylyltransferase
MVRQAVQADPRFEVSTLELERSGPSYTVDTVRALRHEYPDAELFLVMGIDQFRELASWHEPEELVRLVRLAVMDREGESAEATVPSVPGAERALSVPVGRVDVSATAVRAAIREGREVSSWLPPGVERIIEREGLYSSDE